MARIRVCKLSIGEVLSCLCQWICCEVGYDYKVLKYTKLSKLRISQNHKVVEAAGVEPAASVVVAELNRKS